MLCSSPTRQLVPHLQSPLRTSVVPVVVRCINHTLTMLTFRLSGWDLPSLQINGGFFPFLPVSFHVSWAVLCTSSKLCRACSSGPVTWCCPGQQNSSLRIFRIRHADFLLCHRQISAGLFDLQSKGVIRASKTEVGFVTQRER